MAQEKRFQSFREKYYQDHSWKIVLGTDGNPKVEYVYEGIYYTLDGSDRQWKRSKTAYPLLTAAGAVCLLSVMLTQTPGNYIKDIVLLQAVSMLLFFGAAIGAFNRITAPRHMTKWEHRMGVATPREFSLLLLISLAALMADEGVSALTGRFVVDGTVILLWLKIALCFVLVLVQYRLLKQESYLERISDDLPSGIDITNDFEAMP